MARRRYKKTKEVHLIELKIAGGVPLFAKAAFSKKIINALQWSCENRGLRIYDYTLLPDRIVMIANTAWGSTPEVIESFKYFTSKAVMLMLRNGKSSLETSWMLSVLQEHGPQGKPGGIHIWQENSILKTLYKQDQIDACAVNIHNRAVKMGLVAKPEHYKKCSACPNNPLDGWIVEATDPWS